MTLVSAATFGIGKALVRGAQIWKNVGMKRFPKAVRGQSAAMKHGRQAVAQASRNFSRRVIRPYKRAETVYAAVLTYNQGADFYGRARRGRLWW